MKKVQDFFKELGFSEIESRIYEFLLETGPSSVKEIADKVDINRVTAHYHIEGLIKKGILTETRSGARRQLIAEKLDRLEYLVDQKVESALNLKEKFPDIVKTINQSLVAPGKSEGIQIKYYEGEQGVRSIYKEVLKSKELRSYVNINRIFELFPENPQLFPENIDIGKLKMFEIIEDSEISREYVKTINPVNYKYKFFPEDWKDDELFDYMIFDYQVAIITSKNNNPSGILINNKAVYLNAKYLFDIVWKTLPNA